MSLVTTMTGRADTWTDRTPYGVEVTCVEKSEEMCIDSTPASEAAVEADLLRTRRNHLTESV